MELNFLIFDDFKIPLEFKGTSNYLGKKNVYTKSVLNLLNKENS